MVSEALANQVLLALVKRPEQSQLDNPCQEFPDEERIGHDSLGHGVRKAEKYSGRRLAGRLDKRPSLACDFSNAPDAGFEEFGRSRGIGMARDAP